MFKKGQVVRDKETGVIFLIEGGGAKGSLLDILGALAATQLPCGTPYLGRFNSCELIGNHYRAKPKCSR